MSVYCPQRLEPKIEADYFLCPLCEQPYNHITRCELSAGAEHRDEITALELFIDGECGHQWNLVIQQYKGTLSLCCQSVKTERTLKE